MSGVPAPELGAPCIKEALTRAGAVPDQVDGVIMDNVISAAWRPAAGPAGLDGGVGAGDVAQHAERTGGQRGIASPCLASPCFASPCIGGGEAGALAVATVPT